MSEFDDEIIDDGRDASASSGAENRSRTNVGELQDFIDDMLAYLAEAKSIPLSNSVLVDREEFADMLKRLRSELPDELRAARWMVREREAFIARTNERAHVIIERAKSESRRLVSESYILAEAVEEANILVRRAEGEARRLRLEAEDEIEHQLEQIEGLMGQMLTRTHAAREELHRSRPAPPEVPL